jgi:NAD(P)-dependent dehydrogenase (short-subunit alcohol dehydrogenase family)/acyl carrier protein
VLQQALAAAGDTCARAPMPLTAEEWRVLIDDSRPAADSVVLVVAPEDPADTRQAERACGSIAAFARAGRGAASRPPRLFVVTGGSQPAKEGEKISHAAAPLWGLTRVFALEHPELWGGAVDLPGEPVVADAARAAEYIRGGSHVDDQIAIRAGRVYTPRLDRLALPQVAPLHLPADATYVITGGFGTIGLALARRLVARGARNIALVGRRNLPPREQWESPQVDAAVAAQIAAIRGMESAGTVVHLCQADVTRRDDVTTLFARLREKAPPVRGVFHAAGVSRPADIADTTAAQLAETFASKVTGAALLDEATRALPLDYFVLFSSVSAVWGSRTLGGYAAANHYLDALAHRRRALGLPALSINWGPWAGSGMMDAAGERWLAAMGVRALAADTALGALEALMASPHAQAVVADVDWNTFLQVYEAKRVRPFMERLRAPQQPAEATAGSGSLERLSRMLPLERHDQLVLLVASHVEQVVGPGDVGLDDGLFDMGMDSLMATQLRRRLEKDLGRDFPPTLTFDYPSVSRLVGFIERQCFAPPAAPPEPPHSPEARGDLASAIAALEALPDDEAELLLLNRGARSVPR